MDIDQRQMFLHGNSSSNTVKQLNKTILSIYILKKMFKNLIFQSSMSHLSFYVCLSLGLETFSQIIYLTEDKLVRVWEV